jgi:hypothetical protein
MRWALFQQVMQKLVSVRELDPRRDAAGYAEQLLAFHPKLFARIDGGVESVAARMAARTIAIDHLGEVSRLPTYVDELERSLAVATMTSGERLVRVSALAYLVCSHDLIRDDLPAGYGLIDDCITIRGAVLATPSRRGQRSGAQLDELLRLRYLALAVPDELLAATEAALNHAAALAMQTRELANHVVDAAIRYLVEHPPTEFPAQLPLPEYEPAVAVDSVLSLTPAELVEVRGETLVFAFPDGSTLRREAGGALFEG